jgi:NADPH2:quinone reductase
VHQFGGPETLAMEELPFPKPGKGEALIRLEAIGVNFIDVYQRMGLYRSALPFTPGNEGAGVVEDTGPGSGEVSAGDRVAYAGTLGSYAEWRSCLPGGSSSSLGIDAGTPRRRCSRG